ncbi:MAG: PAS domain-containing protein [Rhizobiaceae bacterium]|nr:PAS domain-containing protein [Rhizobiaceae bacterium]
MKQDGSIKLFQYWNRLRDGRPAPRRTEVEPADIKALLGDTFILENDLRGEAVFRLAGTRLCATYGRELKGFGFSSLWREKDRRMMARLVRNVFADNSVLVASFEGISRGERRVSMELLLLPLEGGDENRRALGIASPGTKPYWLGADPLADASLESVRVVDPDREPLFLKNRPAVTVPSLSPTVIAITPSNGEIEGARRIRHLVVLPGGRSE